MSQYNRKENLKLAKRALQEPIFTIVQLLKLGSRVDGHFWFKDDGDNNLLYKSLFKKKRKKRIKE